MFNIGMMISLLSVGVASHAAEPCLPAMTHLVSEPRVIVKKSAPMPLHVGYYFGVHPLARVSYLKSSRNNLKVGSWFSIPGEPSYLQVVTLHTGGERFTARDPLHLRDFTVAENGELMEFSEVSRVGQKVQEPQLKDKSFDLNRKSVAELMEQLFSKQKEMHFLFETRTDGEKENLKAAILFAIQKTKEAKPFTVSELETINSTIRVGNALEKQFTWEDHAAGIGLIRGFPPRVQSFKVTYLPSKSGGWDQFEDGQVTNYLVDLSEAEMENVSPYVAYLAAKEVPKHIEVWLQSFNLINEKSTILEITSLYRDFILIHPFLDGNGRTARLLLDLMLLKAGYRGLNHSMNETYEVLYKTKEELATMITSQL